MTERLFRYYPHDFGELTVRVVHMDIRFDVFDDHTRVLSQLTVEPKGTGLPSLSLNAKNLEILSVGCPGYPLSYEYERDKNLLHLTFEKTVPAGTTVTVTTETICRPTRNLLEGLYYDETPAGAPPQQITQCQQWGFQRIVPCLDDMMAKCTYTTTIVADNRYTNLISNGDPAGKPQPAGNGRVMARYENTRTPMAPYLFFLGCGTYAVHSREFVYPDGHRCTLELLVPPGSDPIAAGQAVDILYDSILWIWLFTGPGMYQSPDLRKKIWALAYEETRRLRASSGADPGGPGSLRDERAKIAALIHPGYQYTGAVYREIGMQNSDYGGMENVGNTTITTNRIMPFAGMTDSAYEYMVNVKVHEFYHNLNGSEVTGRSPFELWLNEAVTVHVENQHHAFRFGKDYSRLHTVLTLVAPGNGTLALDSGAASMPIEPDGFNDPNELITDITYVKGPEFVRMVETLMGKEGFARGLDLYHRRYRHGNASRDDWVRAMEESSGMAFSAMARVWLKQTGFPTVTITPGYDQDEKTMNIQIRQSGFGQGKPWIFPLRVALVDEEGNEIAEIIHRVEEEDEDIVIPAEKRPAFLSLNRGHSFYGRVAYDAPVNELYLQAEKDRDITARYLAFLAIVDQVKMKILLDPSASVDAPCTDLFFRAISDRDLMERAGGQFLTIFESVQDQRYAHRYQILWEIKEKILRSVAERYEEDLLSLYSKKNVPYEKRGNLEDEVPAIRRRSVKNACLSCLARLDTPEIHAIIRDQIDTSHAATDRLAAFSLLMNSSSPDRLSVLASFEKEAAAHPVSWENFLSVVGSLDCADVVDILSRIEQSGTFRIEQTNDQRALYGRFAMNRKRSLQTEPGRAFLEQTLQKLCLINEYSTVSLLHAFDALDLMEEQYHVPLVKILARLLTGLDPRAAPSVYNTARRILLGSPAAVANYEREEGRIDAFSLTG